MISDMLKDCPSDNEEDILAELIRLLILRADQVEVSEIQEIITLAKPKLNSLNISKETIR